MEDLLAILRFKVISSLEISLCKSGWGGNSLDENVVGSLVSVVVCSILEADCVS